jgi:hypothetical protein
VGKPPESSVGELFGRLGEDGRAFVQAEIGLVKAIAAHRIANARNGGIALVVAILLINAAIIALVVSIALALALHLGPLLGGLITFVGVLVIAGVLGWWGVGRLGALAGDAEERAALGQGKSR